MSFFAKGIIAQIKVKPVKGVAIKSDLGRGVSLGAEYCIGNKYSAGALYAINPLNAKENIKIIEARYKMFHVMTKRGTQKNYFVGLNFSELKLKADYTQFSIWNSDDYYHPYSYSSQAIGFINGVQIIYQSGFMLELGVGVSQNVHESFKSLEVVPYYFEVQPQKVNPVFNISLGYFLNTRKVNANALK